MRIKIDHYIDIKNFRINRIIRYLVLSDILLLGGWGLMAPIFSIFIIEKIPGATLVTVGIETAIYWTLKSILQLPIALYLDKNKGEKDDFYALLIGLVLAGFAAFSFTLVRSIPALYTVAVLQAAAFSLYIPSWNAIFSRHLDREQFALEWSLNSTSMGLASGFSAVLGGTVAKLLGFNAIFVLASIFSFASAALLFFVPTLILPKASVKKPVTQNHTPLTINK